MSETPIRSYNDLIDLLVADGVPHQASPAERGALVPTRMNGLEAAIILRWSPEQGALHVVHTFPGLVPTEARPAVLRAITLLNHALALPGLSMDVDQGALYYRSLLPILRAAPPLAEDLRRLFSLVARNGAELLAVVVKVVSGTPPEAAVEAWLDRQRPRAVEA